MAEELPPPRVLPTNRAPAPRRDDRRRVAGPLMWVAIGAVVVGAGLGGYLLGRGGDSKPSAAAVPTATDPAATGTPPTAAPTAVLEPTAATEPTAVLEPTAATEPTATQPPATAAPTATATEAPTASGPLRADPDADPGPDAPTDVADVAALVEAGEAPDSRGIVKDGRIYLIGTVPSAEDAAAIVELAGQVLGPDNVYNGYYIDERAGDPSEGVIRVDDTILFATGSAVIQPEFEPLLNQGFALLSIQPAVTFTLYGHTDDVGDEAANQTLSEQRAQAVVAWYVARGIDPARLTGIGRGETEPLAPNDTEDGRELNRRIEVLIENLFG